MLRSAHKIALLFIGLFLVVTGVVLAGSLYYKNGGTLQSSSSLTTAGTPETSEAVDNRPRLSATLQLIPEGSNTNTYSIVASDITLPIAGVVFQLRNASNGSQFTSNTVELDPTLQSAGWSTAVNTSTEVDQTQELSFSMVLNSPGAEVKVESLKIGTITFDQAPTEDELSLVSEESYITYSDDQIASLNLVLETDTIEN
jgi:hypothetical protein